MRFVVAAWISMLGCGDGMTLPMPDAPMTRGDISVRVADDMDIGVPGCRVFFQTVDSLVEATAITGSDGMATAEVTDGGFVTIIDGDKMTTFSGAKAGDVLAVPHPTTWPQVELAITGSPDAGSWTTCGFMNFVTASSVQLDRCAASADVVFVNIPRAAFQTVALVDGGTIDGTLPLVDETTETVSLSNAPSNVYVQQWLITSRGRLMFDANEGPSTELHQPSVPGATFKTVVGFEASGTGVYVVDPTPTADSYQLDLADVVPSAVGAFTTELTELRWNDDGSRPPTFVVAQEQGWTLIAPVEYRDGLAAVRVPALPARLAMPIIGSLTTFADGETYDAVRSQAANYWIGLQSETDGAGGRLSGKSTPSRRVVAQRRVLGVRHYLYYLSAIVRISDTSPRAPLSARSVIRTACLVVRATTPLAASITSSRAWSIATGSSRARRSVASMSTFSVAQSHRATGDALHMP